MADGTASLRGITRSRGVGPDVASANGQRLDFGAVRVHEQLGAVRVHEQLASPNHA
jgi:hypothetical protein